MNQLAKNNPQKIGDVLTSEILWSLGRIGSFNVSSDREQIVYEVKYFNISENKGINQFHTVKTNGNNNYMITNNDNIKFSPTLIKNGKIAFLQQDKETKETQLYQMNSDGTNIEKLTHFNQGIDDFLFSPDNSKIIFISHVKNIPTAQDLYPDLDKASGLISLDGNNTTPICIFF